MSAGRTFVFAVAITAFLSGASVAAAASFYASPTGTTSTGVGTGTITNPWAIQTALSQPSVVHPGDTIWLRGGTYIGNFVSYVTGTAGNPIVVRNYPGERAIIDGRGNATSTGAILAIGGGYARYQGLEIIDSTWISDFAPTGIGPAANGPFYGIEIVNCIVHDVGGAGISPYSEWRGAMIYGNLIFYNGGTMGQHDHNYGIYGQNLGSAPPKVIEANVIVNNWGPFSLQIYTQSSGIDHFVWRKNAMVSGTGALTGSGRQWTQIGSGSVTANDFTATDNLFYGDYNPSDYWSSGNADLGYCLGQGLNGATITGNYFGVGAITIKGSGITCTGNTFSGGAYTGWTYGPGGTYPSNTFASIPPAGNWAFVWPNTYEAGRGNLYVANWTGATSQSFNLSSILSVGSTYEIRDVLNFFGPPVATGTYAGGSVAVPLSTNPPVAAPMKIPSDRTFAPKHPRPFWAFVVLTTSGGGGPTPAPVAAFTFSPASPQTNSAVTFADTSTGSPTSWQWNFGDGGTSTLRNPTHTYAVAGMYPVTLIATNAGGPSQTTRPLTVSAPPVSSAPSRFYTVSPCRLIDTRNPNGPRGGPALAANGARVSPVAGGCGIPSNARAVSANVTVANPMAAGRLRIYPGNTGIPSASVIEFRAGQSRANSAMVLLATDGTGTIGVKNDAAATVHFVLDVSGYFR